MDKQYIRSKLSSLINRRQKQADMDILPLTVKEAMAISALKTRLDWLENKSLQSHKVLVMRYRLEIETLLPGPRTRFFKFRESIIEMIRVCQN